MVKMLNLGNIYPSIHLFIYLSIRLFTPSVLCIYHVFKCTQIGLYFHCSVPLLFI